MVDTHRIGHIGRVLQGAHHAVGQMHPVDDRRSGRQEVEIELAGQPLLDDLEMEQTEKPAAEPETQSDRSLGLVLEARIVEAKLGEAVAQPLEIVAPTRQSATVLMPAVMTPISPGPSVSTATPFGVNTPTRSIVCTAPVAISRTFCPGTNAPSLTRTRITTPR